MAAITTYVGANIIKEARKLTESIGRPLELDTDGIWACFPGNFPEEFTFKTNQEKRPKFEFSYPCSMLNILTHKLFANHSHQVWILERIYVLD